MRISLVAGAMLIQLLWPSFSVAQAQPFDSQLAKGIRQVEEGDLEGAAETLSATVRRLSVSPARPSELAQAYLYLGIAYALLEQEKAARANFREALRVDRAIQLRAEMAAPRVQKLFDAALVELGPAASPTPSTPIPAATPRPVPAPPQKAIIYIYYPEKHFLDPGHPVYLDEMEVAKLSQKSYLVAKVDAGIHFLRSRSKKDMIQVRFAPGETQFFQMSFIPSGGFGVRMVIRQVSSDEGAVMMLLKPTPAKDIKNSSIVIPNAKFPYTEGDTP